MATYDEWNQAIAEYFVSGTPSGATVYLSVDDEALVDIGNRFEPWDSDRINWVEDFIQAVRSECVIGNRIHLEQVYDYQPDMTPRCVAFLGAMILAAHRMVGEEDAEESTASTAYFIRLRKVLGLPEEKRRPEGLRPEGIEEKMWQTWNWWLIRKGWLPSAERGQSRYDKYINYPLSQALLREGDKEILERLFQEEEKSGRLSRVWDRDTLASWLRRHGRQLGSKHLRELAQESDPRRYEAIVDAVYDVYISIDWNQEMPKTRSAGRLTVQRRLTAGLYRDEDPIMGAVDYWLYPRQPRQFAGGTLEVIRDGHAHPLREDRPGWFLPLWMDSPAGGISYEVRGHPLIKEVVLPEHGFWILTRDPENEASGVFASWGHPGLGETFLLLCRKEYAEQMELLRQEDLIRWDHQFFVDDAWIEYRECMIVSPSWDGVIPQRQDLYDALKPTVSATIALKGGLRVSNQSGWLEGYVPEVTIIAFDDSVELKLLDVSCPEEPIIDEVVNTNKRISFPALNPGDYLLEAYSVGKLATRRTLRILPWHSLDCEQPEHPFDVKVGTFTLQGAVIKVVKSDDSQEE